MRLQDVILRDTRANQPSFADVPPGTLFYVTDEGVTERCADDGLSWEDYSDSGSASGDVVGPASAVDDRIATFDGITGKLIQDGGFTIADIVAGIPAAGITQLTGDVTAGPGSGSQAATIPADTVTFAKMQNIATGKVLGRGSASSGDIEELTPSNGIETTNTPGLRLTTAERTRQIGITIDGGGSAITTGLKGFKSFPVAGTITGVRMLADVSGSAVVDIWKDTYAAFPPAVGDSITASAKPTISAAQKSEDTTLTGWTTSVSAGDVFGFNVDSASTITRLTLELTIVVTG